MAKKSNVMRFRRRHQAKIMAERSANNVSAYGGLGSHGLDFGQDGCPGKQTEVKALQELEGSFSRVAQQYATSVKQPSPDEEEEEDDLLVNDDLQNEVQEELANFEFPKIPADVE